MVHCIFIDGKWRGMPQFHIAVLMKRDNNINNRNQTYRIGWEDWREQYSNIKLEKDELVLVPSDDHDTN